MMTVTKNYKVVNGTSYKEETASAVVDALEISRLVNERVRIYLGHTDTGQSWHEEHDIMGYVGRSTGDIKIPLLIPRKDSLGGGPILDHCIVKIVSTTSGKVLYEHESFRIGEFELINNTGELLEKGYTHGVYIDGKNHANFKDKKKAERWIAFMKGERNAK